MKVEHINLRQNLIEHLPAFEDLPQFKTLYLDNNMDLRTVDGDIFAKVSDSLTDVRLSSVQFSCKYVIQRRRCFHISCCRVVFCQKYSGSFVKNILL